jgi:hypothetical protein
LAARAAVQRCFLLEFTAKPAWVAPSSKLARLPAARVKVSAMLLQFSADLEKRRGIDLFG